MKARSKVEEELHRLQLQMHGYREFVRNLGNGKYPVPSPKDGPDSLHWLLGSSNAHVDLEVRHFGLWEVRREKAGDFRVERHKGRHFMVNLRTEKPLRFRTAAAAQAYADEHNYRRANLGVEQPQPGKCLTVPLYKHSPRVNTRKLADQFL